MIRVSFQDAQVRRMLRRTKDRRIPQLAARAINRGLAVTMTESRREIAETVGVKQKAIGRRFFKSRIRRARRNRLNARFEVGTLPLAVRHFPGTKRNAATGAKVGSRYFEGAFVQTKFGQPQVFERLGEERLPIRQVTMPIEVAPVVERIMRRRGGEAFKREFRRLAVLQRIAI